MSPAAPSQAARDLNSIIASFAKVQILHYASEGPTTAATIAKRLGHHGGPANPAQILASLVRRGLLRAKAIPATSARQYCLTPKGRRLLGIAKMHLRQVVTRE